MRLWSMWSVWLVFSDCGFRTVCPLMDKDKRLMDLPDPRIELTCFALQEDSLPLRHLGSPFPELKSYYLLLAQICLLLASDRFRKQIQINKIEKILISGSFILMQLWHIRVWSTGEGNGKLLQDSCLENPMNSMKRQKDRTVENRFMRGRLNVVMKALREI